MKKSVSNGEQTGKSKLPPTPEALRAEVLDALRSVLKDSRAPAAAKASAGRTILEHYAQKEQGLSGRRGNEMTLAELDEEIARHSIEMSITK